MTSNQNHLGWMCAAGTIALSAGASTAQTPIVLDPFTFESVDYETPEEWVRFTRTLDELSAMRVRGVDPELVGSARDETNLPTPVAIGFEGPIIADPYDIYGAYFMRDQGSPESIIRFHVDRNTTLNDGGIGGGSITSPSSASVASLTQGSGQYNVTDLEVQWFAGGDGPVDLVFLSGITAIEAQRVTLGEARDSSEIQRQVVAVPTIGSAVRWDISDTLSLSGQATTQTLDLGSSLLGFQAKTDWRLSDRVGLSAGYQMIRSEFDLGAFSRDLSEEGLFARLQIKF